MRRIIGYMVYTLFLLAIIQIFTAVMLCVLMKRVAAARADAIEAIYTFITPVGPKGEEISPAGTYLATAADLVSERLQMALKTSLMGSISAVSRNEQALMRDISRDQVDQHSPIAGMVLDQLPKKWQNKILTNPAAAQAAINLFNQFSQGKPPGSGGNHRKAEELFPT